jgi:hypothetical protein
VRTDASWAQVPCFEDEASMNETSVNNEWKVVVITGVSQGMGVA